MRWRPVLPWLLAWLLLAVVAGVALARAELARLKDGFDTESRIAHRLLSQRAVQHDAILDTLALLQPAPGEALRRLPALMPQVLAVRQRGPGDDWHEAAGAAAVLAEAEQRSRQVRRAVLAAADLRTGRMTLLRAADPASFALELDLTRPVDSAEWPWSPDGPVAARLELDGQALALTRGAAEAAGGWRFEARKALAADSQPLVLVSARRVGWGELPWGRIALAAAALAATLALARAALAQRAARRRAEELLRLGQVARLNTLGELAAGMAHELNQPLTAVMASTQAAQRLLADEPPDLDTSRQALATASAQARRASEVLTRLRRTVERPDAAAPTQVLDLAAALRDTLDLLAPECQRRGVAVRMEAEGTPPRVAADPVALQQIVHNLVMNALQALEQPGAPVAGARELVLAIAPGEAGRTRLQVRDNGPGIAPEALPRLFEPFFTTRAAGLGLGLSLCETLALGMGARLTAANATPRGAVFTLDLPLAGKS